MAWLLFGYPTAGGTKGCDHARRRPSSPRFSPAGTGSAIEMDRPEIFRDRTDAGRELAGHLGDYAGRPDVLVLGLARGGVPVAFEIALALELPLDVFVVRKLGVPGHEELALGAIASGAAQVLKRGRGPLA